VSTTLERHDVGLADRPRDWNVPILEPRSDGVVERVAARVGKGHPVLVFLAAMLGALVLIAGLSILLGFLVVHVVLHIGGTGAADERVNDWLAAHRTASRTQLSLIGSIMSGGVVLPVIVGCTALVCALLRRWRIAAFVVFVLGVESASYRITTLIIHRHRPTVPRLEDLAVNASYPSGHTAAAIAVYCGLALLLTSAIRNTPARVVIWTFAVAIAVFEAASRMYRGMHHPLDVGGGVVVGVASVCALVLAARAAGAAELGRGDAA
jgi:membrane-associated phospholipid phosphatase